MGWGQDGGHAHVHVHSHVYRENLSNSEIFNVSFSEVPTKSILLLGVSSLGTDQ